MKIFNTIIGAIYPNKCIACGEIINENIFLCDYCVRNIKRLDLGNYCLNCGFENKNCCCEQSIYRFAGIVSVFENSDIAKRAYYSYKFSKNQHYAKFFALEMSNAVNEVFSEIKFDFVCSVPSSKKFLFSKRYDHSKYLAQGIAKQLSLEYKKDILKCIKFKKPQHKSSYKERLTNVEGVFDFNFRIENKTVLLVDDIRTTAATLDECAKILLFAGADAVYCVTLLSKGKKTN